MNKMKSSTSVKSISNKSKKKVQQKGGKHKKDEIINRPEKMTYEQNTKNTKNSKNSFTFERKISGQFNDKEEKKENKEIIEIKKNKINKDNKEIKENKVILEKSENNEISINNDSQYGFAIEPIELEKIIGNYKERGNDYQDLKYFKENGGPRQLFKLLKTNIETGIPNTEGREEIFGSNKIFTEEVPHFCSFVWEALEDLMVRILIASAIIQIALSLFVSEDNSNGWIDGLSIVLAILVVVLVGSITNYQKEQKFHELNEIQSEGTKFTVIRNGHYLELTGDDLLVGDLISVTYGDICAADLILVEGNGIKMDESALTGESEAVKKETYDKCIELIGKKKNVPSPIILSGTNCIEGKGKAIVLAVEDHSQKGIIRRTISNAQEKSQTPLEAKLDGIAELIGYFGLGAGVVTFVALLIRFGISLSIELKEYKKDSKIETIMTGFLFNFPHKIINPEVKANTNNKLINPVNEIYGHIVDIIILCVSIIVVAIPEGLPLAVTLSLAFSIKKLMDRNNLVRKMHACETMGGANYICTDKTGTLTKNEMSVFKVLTGKNVIELKQNIEVKTVGKILDDNKLKENNINSLKQIREDYNTVFSNSLFWNELKLSIALNVDSTITQLKKPNINGDLELCETKNKTDKAFIDFLYRFKSPISVEKNKYLKEESNHKQFPFDSKRKRMTTFVCSKDFKTGYRLFTKGGAENIKIYCSKYLDPESGEIKSMDDIILSKINRSIEEFNKNKLRSLYVAYKDITKDEYDKCEEPNSNDKLIDQYDLIFLAIFGIKDSLRDGVKEAVKKCAEASVNVIMVTGDNIITATAIAKECGILTENEDLSNSSNIIEENPELMNNNNLSKEKYIKELLSNPPKAITGNSFYNVIEGIICEECEIDTNLCRCPKTEAEAKQIAKENNTEPKPVKKDKIKNLENFKKIVTNLKVMARSQPMHKYALVLGLKSLNHVVAVTGDGTNDAPALSKSDVGFAMFSGTDIAKQASDIVIIDNNFSSIITAIIYGRNIYDNIRKFLQFQLTVNFTACIIVFVCACIGNDTPLTPIQMLWVNLIMDSLGSLALATEPPYEELLQRQPTKRNESIINSKMWKHIIIQSLVEIAILLILYLAAPKFIRETDLIRLAENDLINYCYGTLPGKTSPKNIIYGTESSWDNNIRLSKDIDNEECGGFANRINLNLAYQEYYNSNGSSTHMTIIFNVFVYYTLFNQFNCRVIDDSFNIFVRFGRSLLFPLICFFEMALQAVMVEFGNEALHVVERGLCWNHWLYSLGFSFITFIISIICKIIPLEIFIDKIMEKFPDDEEEENEKEKDKKKEEDKSERKDKEDKNKEARKLIQKSDGSVSVELLRDSEVFIHRKNQLFEDNSNDIKTKKDK